jgi:hypothetical protein
MCPHKFKRGRVVHIGNPATSGTQNPGEPEAHEGGQRGSRGAKPPGRGYGGCAPTKPSKGGEFHIGNHATSGTQNPDEPSAYGGGKGGSRGAKPPQGVWGMCPHKFKGASCPHWQPRQVGPIMLFGMQFIKANSECESPLKSNGHEGCPRSPAMLKYS